MSSISSFRMWYRSAVLALIGRVLFSAQLSQRLPPRGNVTVHGVEEAADLPFAAEHGTSSAFIVNEARLFRQSG